MTKVLFCHGAPDRLQTAAAWLQLNKPESATVYAPDSGLANRLDQLLWTSPATGFLAHCRADSPLAGETPLLIADNLEQLTQQECLLNLSNDLPPGFSRFKHLVEIVSTEDAVRIPARDRVKFYRDRGYDIEFRDLNKEPL
jgi:DNA polymerase-3 subunit chi